ncbi:hypothetical protein B0T22DRAFT_473730 [Podospora appendiculata]|uniref:Uncharacterized protein n=1 Tax=Podospora appendiculata TaxID=314037 RepID=A0AAE0WYW8_9PEZI|nr:hypothetical protein B0T22DRAFT_473730 [Podospora appendiculata]
MAPIDYSKWDNLDTDSESEAPSKAQPKPSPAAPAAAPPAAARKAPAAAPPAATSTTASTPSAANPPSTYNATPTAVQGVMLRCNVDAAEHGDAPPWVATTLPADHDVFYRAAPAPVSEMIGIPLIIDRVRGLEEETPSHLDNAMAAALNVDPESGRAPASWRKNVGTVTVVRVDKKPLLVQQLEAIVKYCELVAARLAEGGLPKGMLSRRGFEAWFETYCEEQKKVRMGTGGEGDVEDWREVRSPYEM